jgi:hypothetical protein
MKTNIHIITHPIRKGVVFHKTLCPNYNSHIIIPDGKIVTRLLPQIPKEPCPKTRRPKDKEEAQRHRDQKTKRPKDQETKRPRDH